MMRRRSYEPGVSLAATDESASGGVPTLEQMIQALDSKFTNLLADKDAQIAALQEEVAKLQIGLRAETAAREDGDRSLQNALAAEAGAGLAADSKLQTGVSEVTSRVKDLGHVLFEQALELNDLRDLFANRSQRFSLLEVNVQPIVERFHDLLGLDERTAWTISAVTDLNMRMENVERNVWAVLRPDWAPWSKAPALRSAVRRRVQTTRRLSHDFPPITCRAAV